MDRIEQPDINQKILHDPQAKYEDILAWSTSGAKNLRKTLAYVKEIGIADNPIFQKLVEDLNPQSIYIFLLKRADSRRKYRI